ncbi:pyridoxal phosphate-dependent aminotransferase [Pseudonocardia sp. KRD291]|uniref:pyridoxal phosphate-dependent aminotransferase n=1 Tax=Pseudonocardia sp. KRD291 TaxID=2792007 RepID=UPI001C4A17C7|nr:pyridoxal phosphate-dependent aminotransferase [Pseudonocardia sp. KRD291]MBW0101910.1 pyridoxal phosphate-dependent aminotransferase [Pseudonocardia sp. KRD291]
MDVWAAAGERARTHGDLVNLSAGQPSTPAPEAVRSAAIEALQSEVLGYTVAPGIPELREAIAAHYRRTYDLDVAAGDVVVTTGSSGGFLLAFLAAFDAGDRVAMARPGYPCYRNILTALGCEVVELACGEESRFQPTVAMLEALDEPVRGLILASPANPTGTVLDPAELAALATYCETNGIQLVSDEIYHGITFADSPPTSCAWATSREALLVNSFSKYFSMTGWRLGWLVCPPRLRRTIEGLAGNFTVCPPAPAQHAALGAFTPESYAEADSHVLRYARNRDLLLEGLPALGMDRLAPADGAFYVYADVAAFLREGEDSMAFTYRMLAETGIAVAPGADFDPVDGGRFVRFSCAGATEDVQEALERLRPWLRG